MFALKVMMEILWPDIPLWEIALRSLSVFLFLVIIIRITGKRDIGEMSPADFILLLLISANVHTSLSGDDKSLLGGLIGVTVLILANFLLNRFAFKNRKFEDILKGAPEVLIYRGVIKENVLKRHNLTIDQIKIAMRKHGLVHFGSVRLSVLETDGTISVIKERKAHKREAAETVPTF